IVLPLPVVQRLAARPGDVTTISVAVSLGARPHDVARRLERDFPGTTAVSEPGQAVRIDTSSRVIVSTGWIISLPALVVVGVAVLGAAYPTWRAVSLAPVDALRRE